MIVFGCLWLWIHWCHARPLPLGSSEMSFAKSCGPYDCKRCCDVGLMMLALRFMGHADFVTLAWRSLFERCRFGPRRREVEVATLGETEGSLYPHTRMWLLKKPL